MTDLNTSAPVPTNTYKVSIDVRYEFEVAAESFDEAVTKAVEFRETMPKGWSKRPNVIWIDTRHIKYTVEQELE